MESLKRSVKSAWIGLGVVSLGMFALGFFLSFQHEQNRFSEMGSLAQSHLTYTLQLKDDMALIDWSKTLEKLPSILAFRVDHDSKMIAEGGNQDFCPLTAPDGVSFNPPYHWTFSSTLLKTNNTSTELILVFQDWRGPLFWGFCFWLIALSVGGMGIALGTAPKSPPVSAKTELKEEQRVTKVLEPLLSKVDEKTLTLTLDKDYIICQATPLVAKALGREASELVGNHFLDLLPDPLVMKAIEKGQEVKLIKPFPSHPRLSALLRPAADGTVLIFESETRPQGPKYSDFIDF